MNLFSAITALLVLWGEENRGNARAAVGNGRDVLLAGSRAESRSKLRDAPRADGSF